MRSLIATLTAALLLAGTLGLSTTGAAAAQPGPMPMPGQHAPFGKDFRKGDFDRSPGKAWDYGRPGIQPHPGGFVFSMGGKPFCTPVFAEKWRWSPWSGWYLTTVKVDETCGPQNFRVAPPRW